MTLSKRRMLLVALSFYHVVGFGVHDLHAMSMPFLQGAAPVTAVTSGIFGQYLHTLSVHPLETKMATGAVMAVAGDALAQSRDDNEYDTRRASSFAAFDMAYRALQHKLFPLIVHKFHGQFLLAALSSTLPLVHSNMDASSITDYLAAIEQTLASQLGIVPFFYYPVFFALTGTIQGLSASGSMDRAKETFVPLMKRNLLFWLPVQFIQFEYVPENLQIPFLSICGLCWTVVLSTYAGSTKKFDTEPEIVQEMVSDSVLTSEQEQMVTVDGVNVNIQLLDDALLLEENEDVVFDEAERRGYTVRRS
jgi:hypothetical protein